MHPALGLPEIVSTILAAINIDDRWRAGIWSCLFVNRLFSYETARIIWTQCGIEANIDGMREQLDPSTRDLAQVVRESPNRAQYYANFIRGLHFGISGGPTGSDDEGTQVHVSLRNLKFPALERVTCYGTSYDKDPYQSEELLYYAQPNVKEFILTNGHNVTDRFLLGLMAQCPELRKLAVGFNVTRYNEDDHASSWENNLEETAAPNPHLITTGFSKSSLIQLLENSSCLTHLDIRDGAFNGWSSNAFKALSLHPSLEYIRIPDIPEDWVTMLNGNSTFPKLKKIYTGITDSGFECLVPHISGVSILELELEFLPPSQNILSTASNLPLTSLTVAFSENSTIDAGHLMQLIRNCPNLQRLGLPPGVSFEHRNPEMEGITDATIIEIATLLPNLREFCLMTTSVELSHKAVIGLGYSCKQLEKLVLKTNANMELLVEDGGKMADETSGVLFPKLTLMEFSLPKVGRPTYSNMYELTMNLAVLMPELKDFRVFNGGLDDYLFAQKLSLYIRDLTELWDEMKWLDTGSEDIEEDDDEDDEDEDNDEDEGDTDEDDN